MQPGAVFERCNAANRRDGGATGSAGGAARPLAGAPAAAAAAAAPVLPHAAPGGGGVIDRLTRRDVAIHARFWHACLLQWCVDGAPLEVLQVQLNARASDVTKLLEAAQSFSAKVARFAAELHWPAMARLAAEAHARIACKWSSRSGCGLAFLRGLPGATYARALALTAGGITSLDDLVDAGAERVSALLLEARPFSLLPQLSLPPPAPPAMAPPPLAVRRPTPATTAAAAGGSSHSALQYLQRLGSDEHAAAAAMVAGAVAVQRAKLQRFVSGARGGGGGYGGDGGLAREDIVSYAVRGGLPNKRARPLGDSRAHGKVSDDAAQAAPQGGRLLLGLVVPGVQAVYDAHAGDRADESEADALRRAIRRRRLQLVAAEDARAAALAVSGGGHAPFVTARRGAPWQQQQQQLGGGTLAAALVPAPPHGDRNTIAAGTDGLLTERELEQLLADDDEDTAAGWWGGGAGGGAGLLLLPADDEDDDGGGDAAVQLAAAHAAADEDTMRAGGTLAGEFSSASDSDHDSESDGGFDERVVGVLRTGMGPAAAPAVAFVAEMHRQDDGGGNEQDEEELPAIEQPVSSEQLHAAMSESLAAAVHPVLQPHLPRPRGAAGALPSLVYSRSASGAAPQQPDSGLVLLRAGAGRLLDSSGATSSSSSGGALLARCSTLPSLHAADDGVACAPPNTRHRSGDAHSSSRRHPSGGSLDISVISTASSAHVVLPTVDVQMAAAGGGASPSTASDHPLPGLAIAIASHIGDAPHLRLRSRHQPLAVSDAPAAAALERCTTAATSSGAAGAGLDSMRQHWLAGPSTTTVAPLPDDVVGQLAPLDISDDSDDHGDDHGNDIDDEGSNAAAAAAAAEAETDVRMSVVASANVFSHQFASAVIRAPSSGAVPAASAAHGAAAAAGRVIDNTHPQQQPQALLVLVSYQPPCGEDSRDMWAHQHSPSGLGPPAPPATVVAGCSPGDPSPAHCSARGAPGAAAASAAHAPTAPALQGAANAASELVDPADVPVQPGLSGCSERESYPISEGLRSLADVGSGLAEGDRVRRADWVTDVTSGLVDSPRCLAALDAWRTQPAFCVSLCMERPPVAASSAARWAACSVGAPVPPQELGYPDGPPFAPPPLPPVSHAGGGGGAPLHIATADAQAARAIPTGLAVSWGLRQSFWLPLPPPMPAPPSGWRAPPSETASSKLARRPTAAEVSALRGRRTATAEAALRMQANREVALARQRAAGAAAASLPAAAAAVAAPAGAPAPPSSSAATASAASTIPQWQQRLPHDVLVRVMLFVGTRRATFDEHNRHPPSTALTGAHPPATSSAAAAAPAVAATAAASVCRAWCAAYLDAQRLGWERVVRPRWAAAKRILRQPRSLKVLWDAKRALRELADVGLPVDGELADPAVAA